MNGRHVDPERSDVPKDLAIMAGIFVLAAVVVFGGLWLMNKGSSASANGATTTTATSLPSSTSVPPATSSTQATTTSRATSTSTTQSTTTTRATRSPSDVRIIVLNSTGRAGIAGALTTRLADAGYQTEKADNITPERARSAILYAPGFAREAQDLLSYVPDAEVLPLSSPPPGGANVDIVIVLGAGYQG